MAVDELCHRQGPCNWSAYGRHGGQRRGYTLFLDLTYLLRDDWAFDDESERCTSLSNWIHRRNHTDLSMYGYCDLFEYGLLVVEQETSYSGIVERGPFHGGLGRGSRG